MKTELKQEMRKNTKEKDIKNEAIMRRRKMGPEWRYEKLKKGEDEKL